MPIVALEIFKIPFDEYLRFIFFIHVDRKKLLIAEVTSRININI